MGWTGTEKEKEYVARSRRHSLWLKVVALFAVIVLCGTVYSLILPAIAESNETSYVGTDITNYVSGVKLYKASGAIWVETSSFTSEDSAMLKLTYTMSPSDLTSIENKENDDSVITYIKLPSTIEIPESMLGEENAVEIYDKSYNSSEPAAYYWLENGVAYVRFTAAYLEYLDTEVDSDVTGALSFEFSWDESSLEEGSNNEIEFFEKYDGTVTIFKIEAGDTEEGGDTSDNAKIGWIGKSGSVVASNDEDSMDGYVTYTVYFYLNDSVTGSITLTDTLTGTDASYVEGSFTVEYTANNWQWSELKENQYSVEIKDGSAVITFGDESSTFEAGQYQVTYKVLVKDLYSEDYEGSYLYNKATVELEEEKKSTGTVTTDVSHGKAYKSGYDQGDGIVSWTVSINSGAVTSYLEGVVFTDTVARDINMTTLDESSITITVKTASNEEVFSGTLEDFKEQFKTGSYTDDDGNTVNYETNPSSFDEETQTLTLYLPDGQYKYEITYKTESDLSDLSYGETTKIINDYALTGFGTEKKDSTGVTVTKALDMSKKQEKVGNYTTLPASDDGTGTGKTVVRLKETVTLSAVTDGQTYYDYADKYALWDQNWNFQGYYDLYYMTEDQYAAISVTDGDGNAISSDSYTIEKYDTDDEKTTGLFQITFNEDIEGPIYITYYVYADLTNVGENNTAAFKNYFKIDNYAVSDTTWIANKRSSGTLYKYTYGSSYGNTTSDYNAGTTDAIEWVIMANANQWIGPVSGDITITDTIPEGLTVDETSIRVLLDSEIGSSTSSNIVYSYEYRSESNCTVTVENNEDGTQTLTIIVPWEVYKYSWSDTNGAVVYVRYTTDITDSEYLKSDNLTNTYYNEVELSTSDGDEDWYGHEVNVTRGAVGKSGSFDTATNTLNYEVVVNPDGSDLLGDGEDGQLCVTDTLTAGELSGCLELISVSLCEMTRDSDGNAVAGGRISVLELTNDVAKATSENNTYYMYDSNTYTITAYLSDNKSYVLVYTYLVTKELSNTVTLKNSASVSGGNKEIDRTETESKAYKYSMSGSLETEPGKARVILRKHDSELYSKLIGGATYVLQYYKDGEWVVQGMYITDEESGTVQITGIDYDTLYVLYEVIAPDGYDLDDEKYFFIVSNKKSGSTDSEAETEKPKEADSIFDPDSDEINELSDTGYTLFVEMKDEQDEFYNPDESTTSITVKKKWSGTSNTNTVYFDLYQAAAGTESLTGTQWWGSSNDASTLYEIADGDTIEFTIKYTSDMELPNVTLEISDGTNVWIDSNFGSQTNAWLFPDTVGGTIENSSYETVTTTGTNEDGEEVTTTTEVVTDEFSDFTLEKGHKYKATVTRSGNTFTITYYDLTASEALYTVKVTPDVTMADTATIKVMAQRGTYTVSAASGDGSDLEIAEGTYYGTYKITAADNWAITIDNLPATVASSGGSTVCTYYVKECGAVENEDGSYTFTSNGVEYIVTYSDNNEQGISSGILTITNTVETTEEVPENEETELTVEKKWYSTVTGEEITQLPEGAEITYALYQKATTLTSLAQGGTDEDGNEAEAVKLTYKVVNSENTVLVEDTIDGYVGMNITFTYTNKWASSGVWSEYLLPARVTLNGNDVSVNSQTDLNGVIETMCYRVKLESIESDATNLNTLIFILSTPNTNMYSDGGFTLNFVADDYADTGSSGSGSSGSEDENTETVTITDGTQYTGLGWWNGNPAVGSTLLEDNETATFVFSYDGGDAGSTLTFEINGNGVWVDTNLGNQNNSWTTGDSTDPVIIFSDYSSFAFTTGHVYSAAITRNGNIYTFVYTDLTDGEYCYTKTVITASSLGDSAYVYILPQVGTYTISETVTITDGYVEDTDEDDSERTTVAEDSGVTLYDTYTLTADNNWSNTISNLPAAEFDTNGNATVVYTYYVLETSTTNTDSFISSWKSYTNNDGVYEDTIGIENYVGEYTEDVETSLTVEKKWRNSSGAELDTNGDSFVIDSIDYHLYQIATPARTLAALQLNPTCYWPGGTVGQKDTLTYTGWWSEHSQGFPLAGTSLDDPLVITATTTNESDNNWNNLLYVVYSSTYGGVNTDGYTEYYVGRSDCYGWGDYGSITSSTFEAGFEWADWLAATKEGAMVTITAYLDGSTAYVTLECAGMSYTATISGVDTSSTYLALTVDICTLSDLTVNGESTKFGYASASEYFTTYTDAYEIADGASVEFTLLYNGYTSLTEYAPSTVVEVADGSYIDSIFDGYEKGHIYTVTVTRSGSEYTIAYYDVTDGALENTQTYTATGGETDATVTLVIQRGTYTVSCSADTAETTVALYPSENENPHTLLATNDWAAEWSSLPAQGTDEDGTVYIYSYYVSEVRVEGYNTTYSNSLTGKSSATGSEVTALAGTLTITNTEEAPDDSSYELPMSGGAGTNKWYAFGAALAASATALLLYRKRRKGGVRVRTVRS